MVTTPIDSLRSAPGPLAQSHPSLFPPPTVVGWLDAFNDSLIPPPKKKSTSIVTYVLSWFGFLLVVTYIYTLFGSPKIMFGKESKKVWDAPIQCDDSG